MSSQALCDTACYQDQLGKKEEQSPPLLHPEAHVVPDQQLDTSDCAVAIDRHILQQICVIANLHSASIPSHIFSQ